MPWCPNCRTEYRPEIDRCADCGAELVDEYPRSQHSAPDASRWRRSATGASCAASCLFWILLLAALSSTYKIGHYSGVSPYIVAIPMVLCIALGLFVGSRLGQRARLAPVAAGWLLPALPLLAFVLYPKTGVPFDLRAKVCVLIAIVCVIGTLSTLAGARRLRR